MPLERIYHRYQLWEEVAHNMWGDVADRATALQKAIEFTGDHKRYGHAMKRVAVEWPISCENALTDPCLNKKAWIGHAAVAFELRIPEDITRAAWAKLSDEQRVLANKEAERAIQLWECAYRKNRNIRLNVGTEMLFGWDT